MNEPIDTYRDAFLGFLKEGMTHAEALAQFDEGECLQCAMAEMMFRHFHRAADGSLVASDGRPTLFSLQVEARLEESYQPDSQCLDLWSAGWTSENPNPPRPCQTMSLYWRRPPIGKRKQGRRFLSTNQAWMALQRGGSVNA